MPGKPRLWSDQRLQNVGGNLNYDLAPDGKRFAIFPELNDPSSAVAVCAVESLFVQVTVPPTEMLPNLYAPATPKGEALRLAAHKLPIKTRFVTRHSQMEIG